MEQPPSKKKNQTQGMEILHPETDLAGRDQVVHQIGLATVQGQQIEVRPLVVVGEVVG